MARPKQDLSAKDFRIPLLRVMGELTNFTNGVEVKHENVYAPVFTIMGIERDDYGFESSTKVPMTERWVQWAFREMREKDEGIGRGRGNWSLTSKGVLEAKRLATAVANATPLPVPATTPAPTSLVEAPKAVLSQVVFQDNSGMYHPDPYIRHLGLSEHICLGFFTSNSPLCTSCPAREVCVRTQNSKLSMLATQLAREDTEPAGSKPTAPLQAAASTDTGKIPKDAEVKLAKCQVPTVCKGCNVKIELQSPTAWVRFQLEGKRISSMYHRECYEKIKE